MAQCSQWQPYNNHKTKRRSVADEMSATERRFTISSLSPRPHNTLFLPFAIPLNFLEHIQKFCYNNLA